MRKVRLRSPRKVGTSAPVKGRFAFQAQGNPYNYEWQKKRARFLVANPFCVHCREKGLFVAATVVDHIIPHQGNAKLFWDEKNNWQALCAPCHNGWKQRQEAATYRYRG